VARVLLNLTTNALKYTDTGFVEVAARETGDARIEFSVRDTGPGIDGLDAGPTVRSDFSSSGLGLAICRKLVAAMGGELDVTNHPQGGTKFSFEIDLPAVPACA
jgi:hypothetical protein